MAVEFEKMQLKIAIVRMQRGVQRRIKENSKPYAFICPEYLAVSYTHLTLPTILRV